jgi:hypothetical protein
MVDSMLLLSHTSVALFVLCRCEKHGVKKYNEKEHVEVEHEHPAEKHHKKGKKGKKAKKSLRGGK